MNKLRIETMVLGPLETNTYVLRGQRTCWVVDPADADPVIEHLTGVDCALERIVLTHGHGDHIEGVAGLKRAYPKAIITCPAGDAPMLTSSETNLSAMFGLSISSPQADEIINPGQAIELEGMAWLVLDGSGHTPGGVCYYCQSEGVVLTGDTLFAGSIGRTDLSGGSASRLLASIWASLMSLPDSTVVLPGHGPDTTIGDERTDNPFLAGMRGRS